MDQEDLAAMGVMVEEGSPEAQQFSDALRVSAQDTTARLVPIMDLQRAQDMLEMGAGYSLTKTAVGHNAQLASNMPCEDVMSSGIYGMFQDPMRDWSNWTILDGHAGPKTAEVLRESLPLYVGGDLWDAKSMDRPYTPNDFQIISTIKKAFHRLDIEILQRASLRVHSGEDDLALTIAATTTALSGSCALMALFDPARSVLRVANTGDSRAVLGRWDGQEGKYVAQAMSVDQTGFNPEEVERLRREHPDEDVVDPKTGRVLGIAVSRAFGDSRWKWPDEMSRKVYEKFWGPAPRPNGVVKTPPYLTAEPEIMETQVQGGEHPDFLIMASDGLWDNMSSDDAVTCVQQWLDKYEPTKFMEPKPIDPAAAGPPGLPFDRANRRAITEYQPDFTYDPNADDDTYWDEAERTMKWRVSPKHFIVEDEHCGIHLIKNALGGKRRNLFRGIMSMQPPRSRHVRDDISVQVIFFGLDVKEDIV